MKKQPRTYVMHFSNSNFNHKMKRQQIPQKLVHEKFYIHEKNLKTWSCHYKLSKIYFLKNTNKTCKPNNHNLNCDWKMKTGIIANFIFQCYINRSNHQHIFWKMLLTKCRKNICEGVLFYKIRDWNKLILRQVKF